MNIWGSSGLTRMPHRLWRRFQYWRGMRKLARVQRLKAEAEREFDEGCRLIGRNVKPPMPLWDAVEQRRRDAEGEGR